MSNGVRALLDLLLPVGCGGCDTPGTAWCGDCARLLGDPIRVCPPCCPPSLSVHVLGAYQGRLRTALLAYKERGRRDLAGPLGDALAAALSVLFPGTVLVSGSVLVPRAPIGPGAGELYLVPVPSRRSAAARRGGQHVALLADRAAATLARTGRSTAVAPALRMARGVRDSVGLDLADRQANLRDRVLLRPSGLPRAGADAVLIDDVVTTGATAAACATALLRSGTKVPAIVALAGFFRYGS